MNVRPNIINNYIMQLLHSGLWYGYVDDWKLIIPTCGTHTYQIAGVVFYVVYGEIQSGHILPPQNGRLSLDVNRALAVFGDNTF